MQSQAFRGHVVVDGVRIVAWWKKIEQILWNRFRNESDDSTVINVQMRFHMNWRECVVGKVRFQKTAPVVHNISHWKRKITAKNFAINKSCEDFGSSSQFMHKLCVWIIIANRKPSFIRRRCQTSVRASSFVSLSLSLSRCCVYFYFYEFYELSRFRSKLCLPFNFVHHFFIHAISQCRDTVAYAQDYIILKCFARIVDS